MRIMVFGRYIGKKNNNKRQKKNMLKPGKRLLKDITDQELRVIVESP